METLEFRADETWSLSHSITGFLFSSSCGAVAGEMGLAWHLEASQL